MNERGVILIVGCDCDPIGDPVGPAARRRQGRKQSWQQTVDTLKALIVMLQRALPREEKLKITFLVRSDDYMKDAFGEYAYCARVSHDFLDDLRSKGHEIGWHPHLWRWSGRWVAELDDSDFIRNCLLAGYDCLCDYFRPTSVRTGWDFMSNEVMQILELLGLFTDFSALPGVQFRELSQGFGCDWTGCPTRFYFPSRQDYRSPALESAISVLEMPMTLTRTPFPVRWIRPVVDRYRRIRRLAGKYEPLYIAKHPVFNKHAFQRIIGESRAQNTQYILTSFHPCDVASFGLFSMQNFKDNLRYLANLCSREGVRLVTMTATEAAEHFLKEH